MKDYGRTSVKLFLISLILVGFSSCNFDKDKERPHKEPVDAPKQIVSVEMARMQYDNYTERRVPLIQRYEDSINRGRKGYDRMQQDQNDEQDKVEAQQAPAKFDVARYVYYDYATIKQYIDYIEQETQLANIDISTLRFYFSNYPDSTGYIHPRQNSILISPTLKKNDREYIFYIDDSNPEKPKAALLTNSFKPVDSNGMGDANSEATKAYASFIPSFTTTHPNVPVLPYFAGKSVTMNRGGGVPPPDQE